MKHFLMWCEFSSRWVKASFLSDRFIGTYDKPVGVNDFMLPRYGWDLKYIAELQHAGQGSLPKPRIKVRQL